MVLDKYAMEKGQLSPWMKWTTQMASNLDVEAAAYIKRPGTQVYSVYFGGPSGQIYDMNGSGAGDAGSIQIKTYRHSKLFSDELPTMDEFIEGRITYHRINILNLSMTFVWTDEYVDTTSVVALKDAITSTGTYFWNSDPTPSYWGGTTYWNAGGISEQRVSTAGFSAVGKGPSFYLVLTANTTKDWMVSKIEFPDQI